VKEHNQKDIPNRISFAKVLSEMIKNTITSKVNVEKIGKYSMVLLATLIIQMIINKKIRHWSFSLINFCIFVFSSVGISSALYFLLFKKNGISSDKQDKVIGNKFNAAIKAKFNK